MVEEANAGKIREAHDVQWKGILVLPEIAKAQEAKQRLQVIETAVQATCRAQNCRLPS